MGADREVVATDATPVPAGGPVAVVATGAVTPMPAVPEALPAGVRATRRRSASTS
jgi:hypothetical protein